MGLLLLIGLQIVLSVAGFALLWRRLVRMTDEVARLQSLLDAKAAPQRVVRRAEGARAAAPIEEDVVDALGEAPSARAARAWRLPNEDLGRALRGPTLSPETGRGLGLALLATGPAIGFFFHADVAAIVATGITIGAAMMLVALRPMWRTAAWAGVLTAGAWALVGFALAAAHAEPGNYSVAAALAASAGLTHAHLRRATPGATMALAMSAATLALGSQIGMVSPAGIAFGAIVAVGAIVGSLSLRLEALHLAAFGASVIGLFVLSGHTEAAIWFTPAAAWVGALFLAIASVRVPQLGSRGVALAGTGVFAPFGAIAALHSSHHGLADAYAAAAAFAVLAMLIGALIAASALRRDRGLAGLRVTLWVLTLGAFLAAAGAILVAYPAPLAAPMLTAFAFGVLVLDMRAPDPVWRVFALMAGLLAVSQSLISADMLLGEASQWAAQALIVCGLALPASIAFATAFVASRANAPANAGAFETMAILLAVASADLFVRLVFSGGATMLQPIGFIETGMHAAVWLTAALVIGARAHLGAKPVRVAAINVATLLAVAVMGVASALWLFSFWKDHPDAAAPAPLSRDTLGFLAPSILFWAHWVFWRARGGHLQTRLVLAAGALLLAAFLTVETIRAEDLPRWLAAMIGAVAFALAIVINFAPGVTNSGAPERARLRGRAPSRPVRRAVP
jgi:hypothetical protein